MPTPMSDAEIQQIVTDHEAAKVAALEQRDQRLRDALASGRSQAEIVRASGLSREIVRQALNPEAREAARRARAERRRDA